MKKALIAIIAIIYIIALVIVSFLGTKAEIINKPVPIEEILLVNDELPRPGFKKPTASKDQRIVTVYQRPDESEIGPDGRGYGRDDKEHNYNLVWNKKDLKRDYAIIIEDYLYLYNILNGKYALEVKVLPENATNQDLLFYYQASDAIKDKVKMTSYGEFSFGFEPEQLDDLMEADIIIEAQDFSEVAINVYLRWYV